jgi:hypothetical protein
MRHHKIRTRVGSANIANEVTAAFNCAAVGTRGWSPGAPTLSRCSADDDTVSSYLHMFTSSQMRI